MAMMFSGMALLHGVG